MYEVKVWKGRHDYQPGMDLGEPDEIRMFKTELERSREAAEAHRQRQLRVSERRMQGMVRLTKPLYEQEVAAGLNDAQIGEKYGLRRSTMYHYKSLFKKGDKAR